MPKQTDTTTAKSKPKPDLANAQVAVLMGGASVEREVSLTSGAEVMRALTTPRGAEDRRGPLRVTQVDWQPDGRFVLDGEVLLAKDAIERLQEADVVFSVVHGGHGEDGTFQGFLETLGLCSAGSNVRASALCMDKVFTRELLRNAGLRVAPAELILEREWRTDPGAVLDRLEAFDANTLVIKPRAGGSSVATDIVSARTDREAALERVFAVSDEALVELRVVGTELAAGVLARADGELEGLPPVEIQPHAGRFFDYEEKYSEGGAREVCPPETVSPARWKAVTEQALLAHRTLRCDGYSRTDFIVPDDGTAPVVLEVNTLPGMTPRSLFPQAAAAVGIDYRTLCLRLVEEALQRPKRKVT